MKLSQKPEVSGILIVRRVFGTGWLEVAFYTAVAYVYGGKGTYFGILNSRHGLAKLP